MPRGYLHQVAIALDQLVNALIGGWADETLSSRAWRQRDQRLWGIVRVVIDAMFFWQHGHCRDAWLYEQTRGHLPPGMRP